MSLATGAAQVGDTIANLTNPIFGSEKVTTTTSNDTGSSSKMITGVIAVVVILVVGVIGWSLFNSNTPKTT